MIIKPLFPAASDKTSNIDSDILLLIVRIRQRCNDGKPPKKTCRSSLWRQLKGYPSEYVRSQLLYFRNFLSSL